MRDTKPTDGTPTILVLLAEDQVSVRRLVRKILERAGFTVLVAEDGESAWDAAGRQPGRLDLLVTDVVMPRMYGTELAERITRLRPGLPVLFMSGYTDDERLRRGKLDPCQAFLEKPFTPQQLLDTVRTLLECTRDRRGEAGRPDGDLTGARS